MKSCMAKGPFSLAGTEAQAGAEGVQILSTGAPWGQTRPSHPQGRRATQPQGGRPQQKYMSGEAEKGRVPVPF